MKRILIICGTGVATSTIVKGKVEKYLQDNKLLDKVSVIQSHITNEISKLASYDLVLSTTIVPEAHSENIIDAVPLLTDIGAEEVYDAILTCINE